VNSVNAVQSICPTYGAGGKAQLRDYGWTMFVSMYAAKNKRDLDSGADSELETRSESDLAARQDQDGWTTAFIVENASAPQFRKQVLSGLPSGGSWTITESETISYGWEASVSISADLFGLFTASASVGYSYDESHTSTTATGIPNSCESGQTGFLYWQPTYTLYHGGFADGVSTTEAARSDMNNRLTSFSSLLPLIFTFPLATASTRWYAPRTRCSHIDKLW
jgi:hypothetical protein